MRRPIWFQLASDARLLLIRLLARVEFEFVSVVDAFRFFSIVWLSMFAFDSEFTDVSCEVSDLQFESSLIGNNEEVSTEPHKLRNDGVSNLPSSSTFSLSKSLQYVSTENIDFCKGLRTFEHGLKLVKS
jgi:hypothetical protein